MEKERKDMTLQQLKDKANKLEQELTQLKTEIKQFEEEDKPNPRWKPNMGEKYFTLHYCGKVERFLWEDCSYDDDMYSIGNVFKTKEEAEFMSEKLKVISELKEYASEFVAGKFNYLIGYDCNDKQIAIEWNVSYKEPVLHFYSKEITEKAIQAVGEDRVKKYYLEVEQMNYLIELVKGLDLNPMDVNFKALELAINELSERESKVIEMRYRDRLTLEEVGKHFGVTRERIRQLEQKALRRLKHNRTTFMSVSYAEYKELEKAYRLLVSKIASKLDGLEEMPIKEMGETSILDLGFSVRTTNCLLRSGINTLGQLSNVPYDSLIHIRYLGKKSLNEIVEKLHSLGYEVRGGSNEDN